MRTLEPRHITQMEELVGRPLAMHEFAEVSSVEDLPPEALEIARQLAAGSHVLAVMYLVERVPGVGVARMKMFLDQILRAGR